MPKIKIATKISSIAIGAAPIIPIIYSYIAFEKEKDR